jgi:16S rRNA (cytosine1402-N4)-methyltransferase
VSFDSRVSLENSGALRGRRAAQRAAHAPGAAEDCWMVDRPEPVHVPVLARETIELLGGAHPESAEGWIIDATVGAGGHTRLLLEAMPGVCVLGLDQDPEILEVAARNLEGFGDRVRLERVRMSELSRHLRKLALPAPIGWLCDIGASSLQLDRPERGFSFMADGPLDMRMDPSRERTAADIVNRWDETDLADLIYHEGGETRSRQIARAICQDRRRAPFRRTGALAHCIARALGSRGSGRLHPATLTFQALRRAVNEEAEELTAGLEAAQLTLADGGVMCVISFHSGEDGHAKRFFKGGASEGLWKILTKKPMRPSRDEEQANARARSARLRAARRIRSQGDSGAFEASGGKLGERSAYTLADDRPVGDGEEAVE